MSLSLEELQEVFDEMRIGKVVMYMHDQPVKKEDATIEEQQNDLKETLNQRMVTRNYSKLLETRKQ